MRSIPPIDPERYSRQTILREVGIAGQERLRQARVLVVGAGGLGCPAAIYLAAAGVGTIGLADGDVVSKSNLHRQILYTEDEVGRLKVEVAGEKLHSAGCHNVVQHPVHLDPMNAESLLGAYDIVLDGTDSFGAKYLINDVCVRLGLPNVHGAVFQFQGHVSVFYARRGPCYRCLFPDPPAEGAPSCAEAGVLGVLPGVIGTLQATEAIKLIVGAGNPLIGRLSSYDALSATFQELSFEKDPLCPACGADPDPDRLTRAYGLTSCEVDEDVVPQVTPQALAHELTSVDRPKLLDVREDFELAISRLPHDYHIPMREVPARLSELNPDEDLVVVCRIGSRSDQVTQYLLARGFRRVRNLATGINGWAQTVDPSMQIY